jgi:hydroxypyruvate isomerase
VSLQLSACVEMIFKDLPFTERMARVAACGLPAYEFWGTDGKDFAAIARQQRELGLACATFVGSGGVPLVDASRRAEFLNKLRDAVAIAKGLDCRTLIVTTGNELPGIERATQRAAVVAALRAAAPICESAGISLVLEPLNVLVDHKGYFLPSSAEGFAILDEVGSPAVKMLYDIYHQQITEGNLIATITKNVAKIGHVHVADVPGRHEPVTGEINYRNVFTTLAQVGYAGYVGLEYRPVADPAETLAVVKNLTE